MKNLGDSIPTVRYLGTKIDVLNMFSKMVSYDCGLNVKSSISREFNDTYRISSCCFPKKISKNKEEEEVMFLLNLFILFTIFCPLIEVKKKKRRE